MRQIFLFVIIILMLAVLIFLVAALPARIAGSKESINYQGARGRIDYANKLLSKGLKEQAAEAFEDYLDANRLDPREEAGLLYKLGGIYMDLYKYEKALKSFYKAEMVEPKAEFIQDMDRKIIEALENLGMGAQARYELQARTSLGEKNEAQTKAVARIGKKEITDAEIDRALKKAPQWMRKDLEDSQKRLEFIRDYVARDVLYAKAKRLGLDTKDEVRQTLDMLKKQVVVEELLSGEIDERLGKITPEDIKLYYDANKGTLGVEPARIKVSYISFENESQKDEFTQKLKKQEGDPQETWITEGGSEIAGIGEAKDAIAGLFLKEKGEISDSLKISDKFYIFYILDKKEKRQKDFEEVRSQAEYEYRMKKQQEVSQSLLKKALEEQEVEIFYTGNKNETKKNN
jgi:hypothetical protein